MALSEIKFHRYVNALPSTLENGCLYFVKVGDGFDLYSTNLTGTPVAYKLNSGTSVDNSYKTTDKTWVPDNSTMEVPYSSSGYSTTMTASAGYAYYMPFMVDRERVIDNMGIGAVTVTAGTNVYLGIYDSVLNGTHKPNNKISYPNVFGINGAGNYGTVVQNKTTLYPNKLYFLACMFSKNTGVRAVHPYGQKTTLGWNHYNSGFNSYYRSPSIVSSLPDNCSNFVTAAITSTAPAIFI